MRKDRPFRHTLPPRCRRMRAPWFLPFVLRVFQFQLGSATPRSEKGLTDSGGSQNPGFRSLLWLREDVAALHSQSAVTVCAGPCPGCPRAAFFKNSTGFAQKQPHNALHGPVPRLHWGPGPFFFHPLTEELPGFTGNGDEVSNILTSSFKLPFEKENIFPVHK